MCQRCVDEGMDLEAVERQRKTVCEAVSEMSGVNFETTMKVMLAIEKFSEEFQAKQAEERAARALESARELNPELFAMLEAAGAEFTVQEFGTEVRLSPDGSPEPTPAHERDVPEPRTGLYL